MIRKLVKKWTRFKLKRKISSNPELLLDYVSIKGDNIHIERGGNFTNPFNLQLGSNIRIGSNSKFECAGGITLHDHVTIGNNVKFLTKIMPYNFSYINIKKGVHIGNNVTVNPGVTIGSNNIIPDGVTVNESIPDDTTVLKNINTRSTSFNTIGDENMIFVVGTGRSGSNAIAKILGRHSKVQAIHDSFIQLAEISNKKLCNKTNSEDIISEINGVVSDLSFIKKDKILYSDQKLSAVISELSILYPKSKFIWLIRDLESFVNSAYTRGWFDNSEFGLGKNSKEFYEPKNKPAQYYAFGRINGSKIGSFSKNEWNNMTGFERNCWYWNYWNNLIKNQLNLLDKSRYISIHLNNLSNKLAKVQKFIGIAEEELIAKKFNQAFYKKLTTDDWTDEMIHIAKKYNTNFEI